MRPRRHTPPLHQRVAAWLALLAMLATGVLPAVAHALAGGGRAQGSAGWLQVCTTQGPRWITDDGRTEVPARVPPQVLLDHCPVCALGAGPLAPPPAWRSAMLPVATAAAPPKPAGLPGHRPSAAQVAQPRGPPAHG